MASLRCIACRAGRACTGVVHLSDGWSCFCANYQSPYLTTPADPAATERSDDRG